MYGKRISKMNEHTHTHVHTDITHALHIYNDIYPVYWAIARTDCTDNDFYESKDDDRGTQTHTHTPMQTLHIYNDIIYWPSRARLLVARAWLFERLFKFCTIRLLDQTGFLLHTFGLWQLGTSAASSRAHRPVHVLPTELGSPRDILVRHRVFIIHASVASPEQQLCVLKATRNDQ